MTDDMKPAGQEGASTPAPSAFREFGVSGLDWTMGMVRADPKVELQGVQGANQFDLMRREDPTVAAVLLALGLPLRQASWRVNPATTSEGDIMAAEFVESCLHDMSSSFDDVLTEAATMFPFGWAWMEWVLKKRAGKKDDNGESSQYSDGRLGFRKMSLRGQTSLDSWEFDDKGGIKAMKQVNPGGGLPFTIPIAKSLLFRTTRERNNPEGFSVLRPGYRAWKYKTQMERIEAIGLQRALTGVPKVSFTGGYTTEAQAGTQSDERRANDLIKGLYQNTVLGVVTDDRMTFEFVVPDMQGITGDSSRVIQRYDEAIARSTLAMYILLGSRERGSYALSRELGDLFFMAVDGFIGSVAAVFTRWAVPVLMRYNAFPGMTQYPAVSTAISRRVDLTALADFINKTVGAQVIVPDAELEAYVRELADFPPKAIEIGGEVKTPEQGKETVTPQAGEPDSESTQPQQVESGAGGTLSKQPRPPAPAETRGKYQQQPIDLDLFTTRRRDPLRAYQKAVDTYESVLVGSYDGWLNGVEQTFRELSSETTPEDLAAKWKELVAALLLAMKRLGWEHLPQAIALGYGQAGIPPELRLRSEAEMAANDTYLTDKFAPSVLGDLSIEDLEQIMLLYWGGKLLQAERLLRGLLYGRRAHAGKYSGMYWRSIWIGALFMAEEQELTGKARWVLDPLAAHCPTCLRFGAREYPNLAAMVEATGGILPGTGTECDGYCRCWIEIYWEAAWQVL